MKLMYADIQFDYNGHNYRLDSMFDGIIVVDMDYGAAFFSIGQNEKGLAVAVKPNDVEYVSSIGRNDMMYVVNKVVTGLDGTIEGQM